MGGGGGWGVWEGRMNFFSDLMLFLLEVSSEKRCLEIFNIHLKAPRIRNSNNIIPK